MIESFLTAGGVRVPAITAEKTCALYRLVQESRWPGVCGMQENTGRSLCSLVLETLGPDWVDAHIIVLVGAGETAAGGICAARHLANRKADVTVIYADPDNLSEPAANERRGYAGSGGREARAGRLTSWSGDVIVDALAPADLRSEPGSKSDGLIDWAMASGMLVVSLDVPAGIDATTGNCHANFVRPAKTMTLALPKTGLAPVLTGELLLADIGIPAALFAELGLSYESPFGHRYTVQLFVG